jgi:hypothetical protein
MLGCSQEPRYTPKHDDYDTIKRDLDDIKRQQQRDKMDKFLQGELWR